jgi:hypothetical protein
MNEDAVLRACTTYWREDMENPKERNHFQDLDIDGLIVSSTVF